uniref:Uncharacterized protein n=1 Tax=Chromera velia CCMP2878 TaxID=1169474 RepID=A0A0G4FG85_9ALVE|eukprot:Cvel_16809.t1-p1 / transcript=Cvel_16809.t1 / gene=Cvel_16809 / organism=Chromera_velia_CCMP2878 / gene_product=hypothetical protein / transcript_product=hypothetical protein / location=Cvel_scaffold1312:48660-49669(-) / protein_length=100 / sequence_SO=supercontig / SO=protein_coding / is_pseudo=false
MLESRPGSVPLEALLPETDRATGGQTGSEGLSPSAPSRAAAAAIAGSRAQVFRAVEKAIPDLPEVGAVVAEKLLRSSFSHIATMQEAISRRVSSLKLANA